MQRLEELLNNLGIDPLFNAALSPHQFDELLAYTAQAGSMAANPAELSADQQKTILADAGIIISDD